MLEFETKFQDHDHEGFNKSKETLKLLSYIQKLIEIRNIPPAIIFSCIRLSRSRYAVQTVQQKYLFFDDNKIIADYKYKIANDNLKPTLLVNNYGGRPGKLVIPPFTVKAIPFCIWGWTKKKIIRIQM